MITSADYEAQGKRRKIAGRSRSGSCIDTFSNLKNFELPKNPEWLQAYPNQVYKTSENQSKFIVWFILFTKTIIYNYYK